MLTARTYEHSGALDKGRHEASWSLRALTRQRSSKREPGHPFELRRVEVAAVASPITLDDGEPEPDLAVIRGRAEDYVDAHPAAKDVTLVVEVADATLDRDRGIKLQSDARAAVPAYWIVNLVDRCVEVYTAPDATVVRDCATTVNPKPPTPPTDDNNVRGVQGAGDARGAEVGRVSRHWLAAEFNNWFYARLDGARFAQDTRVPLGRVFVDLPCQVLPSEIDEGLGARFGPAVWWCSPAGILRP